MYSVKAIFITKLLIVSFKYDVTVMILFRISITKAFNFAFQI